MVALVMEEERFSRVVHDTGSEVWRVTSVMDVVEALVMKAAQARVTKLASEQSGSRN